MRALFVEQGRAGEGAAMGLIRVHHAIRSGLEAVEGNIEVDELSVRPFTRWERRYIRYVPRLKGGGFGSVRWHLTRGWVARRAVEQRLAERPADVVHMTTDQISLVLGRLRKRVPIVLSLDTLTVDWAKTRRYIPTDAATPGFLKPLGVFEKRALERAPLAIAWTDAVAERIHALAPAARVEVVHPGIDLREFHPAPERRLDGSPTPGRE